MLPQVRFIVVVLLVMDLTSQLYADDQSNPFRRPALNEASLKLQLQAVQLSRSGQLKEALAVCEQAVTTAPFSAAAHFNLAWIQVKSGQNDDCLKNLKRSIELGYRDPIYFRLHPDFAALRERPEFAELVEEAKKPFDRSPTNPSPIEDGIAWVGPENTVWDESFKLLRTGFQWTPPEKPKPVILEHGEIGKQLRTWFSEGTAAGNFGDLYDNCDRDHSNLKYAQFPQLSRIEYRPEIAADIPFGLQNRLLHGGVVLGNASTANTTGPFWRSNPRQAYVNPASMATLALQYSNNHLYLYPEHKDHDPGHNGSEGFGDVYPANTPYLLITQGSSYTDQPFLDAFACTLAAFRPDVKRKLIEHGIVAPTLQQIFRSSYKPVRNADDYLTGLAHPSVFDGSLIDVSKMVESAHAMTTDTIPPLVRIHVERQENPIVGREYFEIGDRENLFDTPCAVARIGRSTKYRRQITVSTKGSFDVNRKPLKFKWVVLRGDESRISLKPVRSQSNVEINVEWHPRRQIGSGSTIESNRVDIGVFAHNGSAWSAPAFVTWYFLDNEDRDYDDQGRIRTVTYHGGTDAGNYVDPLLQTPKTWTDSYRYASDGRLIGWTRTRGTGSEKSTEDFTAHGGLVIEKDDRGRALTARTVRYVARANDKGLPVLVQELADELFRYEYQNDEDQVGKFKSREKSAQ